MIQFNLLPDVKLEFVRAQRIKHAVVSGAVIASGAAVLIFLLLFIAVHVVQTKVISDQSKNIAKYNQQLKDTKDIDKILTIQGQLGKLPALHAAKPTASRTFNMIEQMTPITVSLTDVTVNYVENTVDIKGKSAAIENANVMIDTMKFATFKAGDSDSKTIFTDVVLSTFSRNAEAATFTITATYDPLIFDNADDVTFSVPSGRSTQSYLGAPGNLFVKPGDEE